MPIKIANFTLGFVIPLILQDKGPMTKEECFEIFKPLEITNREFDEAWKFDRDWGHIVPAFHSNDGGESIYDFRADYNISNYVQYLPRIWEGILGDSPIMEYTLKVTCKEMHKDRMLNGIRSVPAVLDAKLTE